MTKRPNDLAFAVLCALAGARVGTPVEGFRGAHGPRLAANCIRDLAKQRDDAIAEAAWFEAREGY